MYILCDYYVFMAKSYKHILWNDFHVSKENHKGSLVNNTRTSRTQMFSTCSNVWQFQGSNTCHDDRAKIIPGSNCKRNLHAAKWPLPAAKLTTAKPASLAETIFEKLSKWPSTTLPTKIADDLCHFSMIPEKPRSPNLCWRDVKSGQRPRGSHGTHGMHGICLQPNESSCSRCGRRRWALLPPAKLATPPEAKLALRTAYTSITKHYKIIYFSVFVKCQQHISQHSIVMISSSPEPFMLMHHPVFSITFPAFCVSSLPFPSCKLPSRAAMMAGLSCTRQPSFCRQLIFLAFHRETGPFDGSPNHRILGLDHGAHLMKHDPMEHELSTLLPLRPGWDWPMLGSRWRQKDKVEKVVKMKGKTERLTAKGTLYSRYTVVFCLQLNICSPCLRFAAWQHHVPPHCDRGNCGFYNLDRSRSYQYQLKRVKELLATWCDCRIIFDKYLGEIPWMVQVENMESEHIRAMFTIEIPSSTKSL